MIRKQAMTKLEWYWD